MKTNILKLWGNKELKPYYQIMDAAKRMYRVGKATEELLKSLARNPSASVDK